jgi:hypothetical protein
MDRRAYRWVAIAAAGLLLTACPSSPTPPAVLGVTIDQPSHAVGVGHVEQLTASVSVVGGADRTVTWTSSAPDVARVVDQDDRRAELTALTEGTADVTATSVADAARHDTITVTVEEPAGEVIAVEIDQPGHTVWVGHPETFSATVTVTGGADPTIEWTNSNAEAAAISPIDDHSVTFTPLVPGDTILTAISVADETKSDSVAITVAAVPPWTVAWTWSGGWEATDVAVGPDGSIAVVGHIEETDEPYDIDAFAVLLDPDGDEIWFRTFGTASTDWAHAVAIDGSSNVYVAGTSHGLGVGGGWDLFVWVLGPNGSDLRSAAFGSPYDDEVWDLAVQDVPGPSTLTTVVGSFGGAYPGYPSVGARDAFAMQLDGHLAETWTRVFGTTADDAAHGIALIGTGGMWVVGATEGAMEPGAHVGGSDAILLRLGADGTPSSIHQFGSAMDDVATAVQLDPDANLTIVGSTFGDLFTEAPAGDLDAFAVSVDGTGTLRWFDQFGTAAADGAAGVALTPDGATTLVVGYTDGALPDQVAQGDRDAFARAYDTSTYDPTGRPIWTLQMGTEYFDRCNAVATDAAGDAYTVGFWSGNLAHVVKLEP